MTDKGFEKAAEFLEDELYDEKGKPNEKHPGSIPVPAYRTAKPKNVNLPENTHNPETGEPIGQGLTELDFAMFQNRFKDSLQGDISPERRALAEARMRGLSSVLSEKSTSFLEYLDKIGLGYTRDVDASGKKIICITLEDIAESDMKKR